MGRSDEAQIGLLVTLHRNRRVPNCPRVLQHPNKHRCSKSHQKLYELLSCADCQARRWSRLCLGVGPFIAVLIPLLQVPSARILTTYYCGPKDGVLPEGSLESFLSVPGHLADCTNVGTACHPSAVP